MLIGDKIKTLRTAKKITQQKLADDIFVSRSAIAKWENGLGLPSEVNLASLCEYFGVDRAYFNDPVTPEDLIEKNRSIRNYKWITKIAVGLTVIILVSAVLFPAFDIHFFTIGMRDEYVSRVDCIDGYYVAVYEERLSHTGNDTLHFGSNPTELSNVIWQHNEMLDIKAYSRFLCFSKERECDEIYYLLNEDGTIKYGTMYVLRSPSGKIHYYYQRFCGARGAQYFDGVCDEEIAFSCEGKSIDLKHYCSFSSDYDFTTGEHILYIGNAPCRFEDIMNGIVF